MISAQSYEVIKFREIDINKLLLEIIKVGVYGEKYKRYNNEVYKENNSRRDMIIRYKKKAFNWKYKVKI